MQIHHDKHHQTYAANFNAAIKDHPEIQRMTIEAILRDLNKIPEEIRTAVRNNGGGHYNHLLYWEIMRPGGPKAPTGALASAIDATFGGVDELIAQVTDAGIKRFGSGWAWLVKDESGRLLVYSTANQDCPLTDKHTPLLCVDVWEHAYYLKYRNMRADYLKAWWNVVNWDEVAKRYAG
jgi:Fe-Mn family superoxide dismutase